MQCTVYLNNGAILRMKEDLNRAIFNNPDIYKVEFSHNSRKFIVNLDPTKRLIYYKKIDVSSPAETTYYFGWQTTVNRIIRGRRRPVNMKTIIELNPNGEVSIRG